MFLISCFFSRQAVTILLLLLHFLQDYNSLPILSFWPPFSCTTFYMISQDHHIINNNRNFLRLFPDLRYIIQVHKVKCSVRVPFVTLESRFVNENLVLQANFPLCKRNSRFVSEFPRFSFVHWHVIIRSAINLHTTIRDQFPLEIFVFGESIPVWKLFCCLCSGCTLQIYLLLFEKFRL